MSNSELKKILIEKINSTQDQSLLKEASRLLEIQLKEIETEYILSDEMESAIDEAETQVLNGEYKTHDDANQEINEWLKK